MFSIFGERYHKISSIIQIKNCYSDYEIESYLIKKSSQKRKELKEHRN